MDLAEAAAEVAKWEVPGVKAGLPFMWTDEAGFEPIGVAEAIPFDRMGVSDSGREPTVPEDFIESRDMLEDEVTKFDLVTFFLRGSLVAFLLEQVQWLFLWQRQDAKWVPGDLPFLPQVHATWWALILRCSRQCWHWEAGLPLGLIMVRGWSVWVQVVTLWPRIHRSQAYLTPLMSTMVRRHGNVDRGGF